MLETHIMREISRMGSLLDRAEKFGSRVTDTMGIGALESDMVVERWCIRMATPTLVTGKMANLTGPEHTNGRAEGGTMGTGRGVEKMGLALKLFRMGASMLGIFSMECPTGLVNISQAPTNGMKANGTMASGMGEAHGWGRLVNDMTGNLVLALRRDWAYISGQTVKRLLVSSWMAGGSSTTSFSNLAKNRPHGLGVKTWPDGEKYEGGSCSTRNLR